MAKDGMTGCGRRRQGGFTLIEVLVACTLLALVVVPAMRAFSANRRVADAIVGWAVSGIAAADAAARAAFATLSE